MADDGAKVVTASRSKALRIAALGAVLLALSVNAVVNAPSPLRWLCLPGVGLFGFGTGFSLWQAWRRRPLVVLRADGFVDCATGMAVGFVPWGDVETVGVRRMFGQRFVDVRLRAGRTLQGQRWWKRVARSLNRRLGAGEVYIPENVLPMTADDLVALMEDARLGKPEQRVAPRPPAPPRPRKFTL